MSSMKAEVPANTDSVSCSPLYEIRQSQSPGAPILSTNDSTGSHPPLQTTSGSPMDFSNVTKVDYRASHLNLPNRQRMMRRSSDVNPGHEYDPIHKMDVDISPTNGSSEHHSSSGHPTPSTTSHKSSSRTSYSPHRTDEASGSQYQTGITTAPSPHTATFFTSENNFAGYSPGAQQFFASTPGQYTDGSFTIPPGWDFQNGHTGMTPDNRTGPTASLQTGLSPLEEGGWANMLDEFGWDGSAGGVAPVPRRREGYASRPS